MLLLKMTHEEVRNEILKDLPNVERFNSHKDKDYRRMSLKMKYFPKYVFSEYVSPRKNRWLITTKFFAKNDFSSTYGILQNQNGLVLHQAFVNYHEQRFSTICTFIPHFFERYAERNGLDVKGLALIKQLLKDDCSFNIDRTQEISGGKVRDKENNVHLCMRHGVGLGDEVGHKHYLIKTFFTYEMSYGRQRQVFESKRAESASALDYDKKIPMSRIGVAINEVFSEKTIKKLKRRLGL